MAQVSATLTELDMVARTLLDAYPQERVFGFYGGMGIGKTTLIKAICKVLQVRDVAMSPTFSIINEYQTVDGQPVYHFDFYRIDGAEEALRAGFEEYLYSGCYCLIEWTEKVESILQHDFIPVHITRMDDHTRLFTF